MKMLQIRNPILLFLTAFIWGVAFVAQSVGMDYVGPLTFNCVRSLMGAAFLLPCIWILKKRSNRQESIVSQEQSALPGRADQEKVGAVSREQAKKDRRMLLTGGLLCGIFLCLATNLQQIGIVYTTVGKAGFITAFYIVIVPVLGLFLKKKCAPTVWAGVALALMGLYFLCMTGELSVGKGDVLVFLGALLFSVHILVIDYFTQRVDGVKMSCIQFLVSSLLSGIAMLAAEKPQLTDIAAAWQPLVYAGVLSCGVAYTLQIVGQKGMNPTVASLILSMESVISVLAGMVLLNQHLSSRETLGCVLMFAAIVLAQLPQRKRQSEMERKRRKRLAQGLLAGVLLIGALTVSGCQSKESLEKEQSYRQTGIEQMDEGNYEEAARSFQKALDQSLAVVGDLEIDICYYKAAAQYKSGDVEGALKTYESLMDYDKKSGDPYYLRGCIYLKENEAEKAKKDYSKAVELNQNDYELYVNIFENLSHAGYPEDGEKFLEQALKLEGDTAEYYRERGHIYLLRGDSESARKELDKAINKGDTKALLYMAQVYDAQGSSSQAQALYKSYVAKNGTDTEALNTLGKSAMEAGNYTQALEFFRTALSAEEVANEQELRRNEIAAYEYLLDFASAKEKMAAYLEDYPEDEEAQREAVFLQTR